MTEVFYSYYLYLYRDNFLQARGLVRFDEDLIYIFK